MKAASREFLCVLLCLTLLFLQTVFAGGRSWAQQLEKRFSERTVSQYNRQKLTIEVSAEGFVSDFAVSSWRSWTPYKGFAKISESDFFQITGYDVEAQKAMSYHSGAQLMEISGGLATLAGIGLIIAAANESSSEGQRTNCLVFGLVLDVLGLGLLYAGWERSSKRWAPVSVAQPIAEEYNYQLRINLGLE